MNHDKTSAILFTKRRLSFNRQIIHNNNLIPWSTHVKYLELTLDNKLTFTTPCSGQSKRRQTGLGAIYLFKGDTYWTLDLQQKSARKTGPVFQHWLSC
uniref:Uncharacterized protein n=1 Tax=Rhodnius prolixus TaxID=13249 RepID=T1H860_RHOPR